TPRPLALAVVLRVAEGQLHRNRLLGSLIDCGRSRWIVQSFLRGIEMSLVVAVWSEGATRSANETVHARLTRLHKQVTLVLRRTSPTFMVFMASEFLFMHAHPAGAGLRWYSKNERDEALRGIAATSRLFGRLLLVGGSICWAKPVSHVFGKTEWRVRNQVPVCYGGKLISLYGKRLEGRGLSRGCTPHSPDPARSV
ncbi:hypothetical protein J7371_21335, partial [Xanthomonas phaseoli pv. dieffenbachiae]